MKVISLSAVAFICLLCLNVSAQSSKSLPTVKYVDLSRYTGTWYEFASLPARFQKGCQCTKAEYKAISATKISVVNSCVRRGKWDSVKGNAKVKDKTTNAKLGVQFFWPFRGKYWILDLADDYSHALVGHPNRKYLWVLSRTPHMDESVFNGLVAKAKDLGFPTAHLNRTPQGCND